MAQRVVSDFSKSVSSDEASKQEVASSRIRIWGWKQCPGYGKTLALTTGKLASARSDPLAQTFRHSRDKRRKSNTANHVLQCHSPRLRALRSRGWKPGSR